MYIIMYRELGNQEGTIVLATLHRDFFNLNAYTFVYKYCTSTYIYI